MLFLTLLEGRQAPAGAGARRSCATYGRIRTVVDGPGVDLLRHHRQRRRRRRDPAGACPRVPTSGLTARATAPTTSPPCPPAPTASVSTTTPAAGYLSEYFDNADHGEHGDRRRGDRRSDLQRQGRPARGGRPHHRHRHRRRRHPARGRRRRRRTATTATAGTTSTTSRPPATAPTTLGGLPTGTYRLRFRDYSAAGYLDRVLRQRRHGEPATDVAVTAGATTSGKDAQLALGGHITGTVTGTGGTPLEGVDVTAYRNDGDGWDYVDDRRDRRRRHLRPQQAAHRHLPPRVLRLLRRRLPRRVLRQRRHLDAATDIAVTAGATTSGKNAQLAVGGHITGTVTGPGGTPLRDVDVTACRNDRDGWDLRLRRRHQLRTAPTTSPACPPAPTASGSSTSRRRLPQRVLRQRRHRSRPPPTSRSPLGATTSGKNAQLAPGGHITGTVTGTGGAPSTTSTSRPTATTATAGSTSTTPTPPSDGTYDVGGLTTGTYRLRFRDDSGLGYLTEYFDNATSVDAATDIAVTVGATTSGKNAQLSTDATASPANRSPRSAAPPRLGVHADRDHRHGWNSVDDATATAGSSAAPRPSAGAHRRPTRLASPTTSARLVQVEVYDAATTGYRHRHGGLRGHRRRPRRRDHAHRRRPRRSPTAPRHDQRHPQGRRRGHRVPRHLDIGRNGLRLPVARRRHPRRRRHHRVVQARARRRRQGPRGHGHRERPGSHRRGRHLSGQAVAKGTLKATKKPKVTGKAKKNATLKVSPGTWSPHAKVTYQWFAGTKAIAKATTASSSSPARPSRPSRARPSASGSPSPHPAAPRVTTS